MAIVLKPEQEQFIQSQIDVGQFSNPKQVIAAELSKRATGKTLYLIDEPTTGLSFYNVHKLLDVLQRLVPKGC